MTLDNHIIWIFDFDCFIAIDIYRHFEIPQRLNVSLWHKYKIIVPHRPTYSTQCTEVSIYKSFHITRDTPNSEILPPHSMCNLTTQTHMNHIWRQYALSWCVTDTVCHSGSDRNSDLTIQWLLVTIQHNTRWLQTKNKINPSLVGKGGWKSYQ